MNIVLKRFNILTIGVLCLLALILLAALPIKQALAAADTCTWTGAINSNWSNGGNWSGCDNGGVPETGDNLLFNAGNSTPNNDMAIIAQEISVAVVGFTFSGNTIELSGNLNVYTTATFTPTVRFTAASGSQGLNVQGATPTFTGGVDLNVTGTGYFTVFTTNASLDLPVFTGTTTYFNFYGNPTAPHEVFNTSTSPSSFITTSEVTIQRSVLNCRNVACLGNASNVVTVLWGDTSGAELRMNSGGMTFLNDVILNDYGVVGGPTTISAGQDATMSGDITVTTSSEINILSGDTLTLSGNISVAASRTLTFGGTGNPAVERVIQNGGVLSGSGDIVVDDVRVELHGNNTYSGATTIATGGVLQLYHANALGTTAGATTVQSGGEVQFNMTGTQTVTEPFNIAGTGISSDGALQLVSETDLTLSGNIVLTANATIGSNTACGVSHTLNVDGVISGTGDLTTYVNQIPCSIYIGGASPNTWTGSLIHRSGYLNLDKDLAVPGDVQITPDGSTASTFVRVTSEVITNAIGGGALATGITIDNDYFNFYNNETITALASDGLSGVLVCRGSTLTVDQSINTIYAGIFGNGGGCPGVGVRTIAKQGSGMLEITADDATDVTTLFNIIAGTLTVNANRAGTDVTINGGTLNGSATLGNVTGVSGRLAIGNSPGCSTVASLTLSSGFNFDEELAGANVCTQYDQTIVTGVASLGNATLNLQPSFTPAIGTVFTIIQAGSVTGTFNGLPNGATVVANGLNFRINYTDTTVTLTFVSGTIGAPNTGLKPQNTSIAYLMVVLGASMMLGAYYGYRKTRRAGQKNS